MLKGKQIDILFIIKKNTLDLIPIHRFFIMHNKKGVTLCPTFHLYSAPAMHVKKLILKQSKDPLFGGD